MIVCDSCKKECDQEVTISLYANRARGDVTKKDDPISTLWRGHLCKECSDHFTRQARQSLRELVKAVYVVPPETVANPS